MENISAELYCFSNKGLWKRLFRWRRKEKNRSGCTLTAKYLHTTILKAPHHGEWYTANSPEFIKTVKADYAVIQDNRYITKVIKNRYKKAGTKILYRLKPGYILIETDGTDYTIRQQNGYQ